MTTTEERDDGITIEVKAHLYKIRTATQKYMTWLVVMLLGGIFSLSVTAQGQSSIPNESRQSAVEHRRAQWVQRGVNVTGIALNVSDVDRMANVILRKREWAQRGVAVTGIALDVSDVDRMANVILRKREWAQQGVNVTGIALDVSDVDRMANAILGRRQRSSAGNTGAAPDLPTAQGQTFSVNDLLSAFPLTSRAKTAFRERVQTGRLSQEQAGALIWQLMAEGENLLSKAEQDESASLYWKAVNTLTLGEQMFVRNVNLRVSQGGGASASGQDRAQALVQKGFSQLPRSDNDRFLQLRAKAIEYALLRPSAAQGQFRSTSPP